MLRSGSSRLRDRRASLWCGCDALERRENGDATQPGKRRSDRQPGCSGFSEDVGMAAVIEVDGVRGIARPTVGVRAMCRRAHRRSGRCHRIVMLAGNGCLEHRRDHARNRSDGTDPSKPPARAITQRPCSHMPSREKLVGGFAPSGRPPQNGIRPRCMLQAGAANHSRGSLP